MKDIFGNKEPVQLQLDEWLFNGHIIVKQNDFRLPTWISFLDLENSETVSIHLTKQEAVKFAFENPCFVPQNYPEDYIGLKYNSIECPK